MFAPGTPVKLKSADAAPPDSGLNPGEVYVVDGFDADEGIHLAGTPIHRLFGGPTWVPAEYFRTA